MKARGWQPALLAFGGLVDITEERKFVAHGCPTNFFVAYIFRFMSRKNICGSKFDHKYSGDWC